MNLIICPSCELSKEERIKNIFLQIEQWVESKPFRELIKLFDPSFVYHEKNSLKDKIDELNEFVNIWDYRKKQSKGGERWTVYDDDFVKKHKPEIIKNIRALGFMDISTPKTKPNYILPLGGARRSNYLRCKLAKEMFELFSDNNPSIVSLTGMRPLNKEVELKYVEDYVPNAETEFDAMNGALEKFFLVKEYTEEKYKNNNINLQWVNREYKNERTRIDSLAAPSSNPEGRAISLDTYDFFASKYNIKKQDNLLLVTSSHYETFQLLQFIDIAIEKGCYVETVGTAVYPDDKGTYTASHFLQEIKSSVNAMKRLADIYL